MTLPDNETEVRALSIVLPLRWYRYVVQAGAREDVGGIYEWHIDGIGSYIGQYKRIRRPTREYGRNIVRLLNKKPYRLGKKDGFRCIHRQLANAHRKGLQITLTILENVEGKVARNQRERELISERGALNCPPYSRRSPNRDAN